MPANGQTQFAKKIRSRAEETPGFAPEARVKYLTKAELVERIKDRFYVNEIGTAVSNGLSTDIICFPSDVDPKNSDRLKNIIWDAMSYSTKFSDIDQLNALLYIPTKNKSYNVMSPGSGILALGLYLYFADEASRRCPGMSFFGALRKQDEEKHEEPLKAASAEAAGKDVSVQANEPEQSRTDATFLEAMHEAHAELNVNDRGFFASSLYKKALKALQYLGLKDDHHVHIMREWSKTGRFTIGGELNYVDSGGHAHGAYAKLAEEISRDNRGPALNRAVSYALGNKEFISSKSEEDALAFTRGLTADGRSPEIDVRIQTGNAERARRISECVTQKMGKGKPVKTNTGPADEILSWLPKDALEILYLENYRCAYTQSHEISYIFPKNDLPGLTSRENESARGSKALRQQRHHIIFLSNGWRYNPSDMKSSQLASKVAAQTLMHEIMHIASEHMSIGTLQRLQKDIIALHEEITGDVYLRAPHVKTEDDGQLKWAGVGRDPITRDPAQPEFRLYDNKVPYYLYKRAKTLNDRKRIAALDMDSVSYENYIATSGFAKNGSSSKQWEEVLCDAYGLTHTEFASHNRPAQDLPAFATLQRDMRMAMKEAVENSRAAHANQTGPAIGVEMAL